VGNKQPKSSEISAGANKLSHNPFANLKDRLALPSAEGSSAAAGQAENRESAPKREPEPTKKRSLGRLLSRRETKHRGGKAVIVVTGFAALDAFDRSAVEELAKELKGKLGCGGTVEEGSAGLQIVIQGDQAKKVAELLRARGFRVDGVVS
jgi:translation initiation factor 1